MKKVIVIGAGMSGIMAARTLQDAGFDVLVLEARDRVGGRTRTDRSLGTTVDLGAAWIHGPIRNPLTPLQQQYGVKGATNQLDDQSGGRSLAFGPDGAPLDMVAFQYGQQLAQGAAVRQIGSLLTDPLPETVVSAKDFADYCLERAPNMTPEQRFGYIYQAFISPALWEAADPEESDWRLASEYLDYPGGDLFLYGGGYNTITDRLAEEIQIETGSPVSKISYGPQGIQVVSGSGIFEADYLVLTVPLGVLKSGLIEFDPRCRLKRPDPLIESVLGLQKNSY